MAKEKFIQLQDNGHLNKGDTIISVKDLVVQFTVRGRTLTAI